MGGIRQEEWAEKGPLAESKALREKLKAQNKGKGPVQLENEGMQFTMSTYKWTWKRYMQNWGIDLGRWWRPPSDYMSGAYPQGGYVWVKVDLSREGEMLGYEILEHNVSSEMRMVVVQALIGARLRPPLPNDFPEDKLTVQWKFIYPTYAELLRVMEEARQQQQK